MPSAPPAPIRVTRTGYDAESCVTLIEKAVGTPRQQNYVAYSNTANTKRDLIADAIACQSTHE